MFCVFPGIDNISMGEYCKIVESIYYVEPAGEKCSILDSMKKYAELQQISAQLTKQVDTIKTIVNKYKLPYDICLSFSKFSVDYQSSNPTNVVYYSGQTKELLSIDNADEDEIIRHGKGTGKYSSGAVYTGQWFDGVREGTGNYLGVHIYEGVVSFFALFICDNNVSSI